MKSFNRLRSLCCKLESDASRATNPGHDFSSAKTTQSGEDFLYDLKTQAQRYQTRLDELETQLKFDLSSAAHLQEGQPTSVRLQVQQAFQVLLSMNMSHIHLLEDQMAQYGYRKKQTIKSSPQGGKVQCLVDKDSFAHQDNESFDNELIDQSKNELLDYVDDKHQEDRECKSILTKQLAKKRASAMSSAHDSLQAKDAVPRAGRDDLQEAVNDHESPIVTRDDCDDPETPSVSRLQFTHSTQRMIESLSHATGRKSSAITQGKQNSCFKDWEKMPHEHHADSKLKQNDHTTPERSGSKECDSQNTVIITTPMMQSSISAGEDDLPSTCLEGNQVGETCLEQSEGSSPPTPHMEGIIYTRSTSEQSIASMSGSVTSPSSTWQAALKTPLQRAQEPKKSNLCAFRDNFEASEGNEASGCLSVGEANSDEDMSLCSPKLEGSPLKIHKLNQSCETPYTSRPEFDQPDSESPNLQSTFSDDVPPKTPLIKCKEDYSPGVQDSPEQMTPSMGCSPPLTQNLLEIASKAGIASSSNDLIETQLAVSRNQADSSHSRAPIIRSISAEEYSMAPKFLQIQMSLHQINESIQRLNDHFCADQDGLTLTEVDIDTALGGHKTKTVLLSLVQFHRLKIVPSQSDSSDAIKIYTVVL